MREKIIERLKWSGISAVNGDKENEIKFSGRLTGTILADLSEGFSIKYLEAESKGVFILGL